MTTLSRDLRICVLVLSSDDEPWRTWSKTQRLILEKLSQGLPVKVFYMFGTGSGMSSLKIQLAASLHLWLRRASLLPGIGQIVSRITWLDFIFRWLANSLDLPSSESDGRIIWEGPENYAFMAQKTISAMALMLEREEKFTHFLRTNNSSVWDFSTMLEFLKTRQGGDLYAGVIGTYGKFSFASGAGILMDRNTAKLVVENRKVLAYQYVDDVTLGEFLFSRKGIDIQKLARVDAPFEAEAMDYGFHYRCKQGDLTVSNMLAVEKYLLKPST